MKKKLIIIGFILFLIPAIFLLTRNDNDIKTIMVSRGEVIEEIFESGIIKKGEEINLSFRSSGRINDIYVKEGSRINKGDLILQIDNRDFAIQIDRAEELLRIAELDLDKIKMGSAQQDIYILQTSVENAKSSFSFAESNFKNIKNITDNRITNLHDNAFIAVDSTAVGMESVSKVIDQISKKYFTNFWIYETGIGLNINTTIKNRFKEIKNYSNILRENPSTKEVTEALSTTETHLRNTSADLVNFLKIFDEPVYSDISKNDFDLLFHQRGVVNQMITSISSVRNSITTSELSNNYEINLAESQFSSAKKALNQAENKLLRAQLFHQKDIYQAEARIRQIKADINLLNRSFEETSMRAPFDGTILRIYHRVGEIAQPGIPIISMLPDNDYYIELNIYEGDIVQIKNGDKAEIEIVAFPNEIILGEVIFIDTAPRIIDGVVYYRLLISMKNFPEGIFPGMTADVVIIINKKDNVLYIPEITLERGISKFNFLVLENKEKEEREVEIGLRGTNKRIEILSGLEEGDIILQ